MVPFPDTYVSAVKHDFNTREGWIEAFVKGPLKGLANSFEHYWACVRKRQYNTKARADRELHKQGLYPTGSSYKCRYCDYWHISGRK
jgi:hypothetical protein